MRVAVVGARGQLAAAVVHECEPHHHTVSFTREELDATSDEAVAAAMDRVRPNVIVNGAAFNDVDGAEDHPIASLDANAFAVRALARAAAAHGAMLVHYSTDFVFDGTATTPYAETDRPNPRSVYATTKLLGEWFALEVPRSYVLRVETLFGRAPGGRPPKGSIAGMVNALLAGGTAKAFEDRTVTPTYIIDAAAATRRLFESSPPPGIYHCVNSGVCTWLELAHELARRLGVEPRIQPVRMADVPMRAARPRYCALSNEKLRAIGIGMPTWQDALGRYLTSAVAAD
jgi:dTDP-4-dehydrorhamnose reductase